jgi:MFS family permease
MPIFRRDFVLLTAANFWFAMANAAFLLLPRHLTSLGATPTEVGLTMAAAGVGGLCLMPIVATRADRFGRRPFILGGALAMGLGSAGYLLLGDLSPGYGVMRAIQGAGFVSFTGAAGALAADLAPPRRLSQALGFYGLFSLAPMGLAPVAGEQVAKAIGMEALYVSSALCALVCFCCALSIRRMGERRAVGLLRVRAILRRPGASITYLVIAVAGSGFGAAMTYFPAYASKEKVTYLAPYFLCYTGAVIFVRTVLGHLGDRIGRRWVVLLALLLGVGTLCSLGLFEPSVGMFIGGAGLGLTFGFANPNMNALSLEIAAAENRAKATVLYNLSFNGGQVLTVLAYGPLAGAAGYSTMYVVAAAVVFAGWVVFATLGPRAPSSAAESPARPGPAGEKSG